MKIRDLLKENEIREIETVGELIKVLSQLPKDTKVLGEWECTWHPISDIEYDEEKSTVYLRVD
jgi:hypothetical protein